MALIACEECGQKVSTKADKCPHCGAPVKGQQEETASDWTSNE